MGMYDTINGEQVKCFPWVHYYRDNIIKTIITYSGGDLKYYGDKSKIPYKKFYYNYGKNFMILDIQEFLYNYKRNEKEEEKENNNREEKISYILHVIRNGKVKKTYDVQELGLVEKEEDFSLNECVVDYHGDFLNIKCEKDIVDYMKALKKYHEEYDIINKTWNDLFRESMEYFTGIGLLDKDSEEKKERLAKIKVVHEKMNKEKERTKDEINNLIKNFSSKWKIDISHLEDLISLGEFLSCLDSAIKYEGTTNREEARIICSNYIVKKLENSKDLFERYIKWYCKDKRDREDVEALIIFAKNNCDFNYQIELETKEKEKENEKINIE